MEHQEDCRGELEDEQLVDLAPERRRRRSLSRKLADGRTRGGTSTCRCGRREMERCPRLEGPDPIRKRQNPMELVDSKSDTSWTHRFWKRARRMASSGPRGPSSAFAATAATSIADRGRELRVVGHPPRTDHPPRKPKKRQLTAPQAGLNKGPKIQSLAGRSKVVRLMSKTHAIPSRRLGNGSD
jgi:hypothetical protein